MTTTVTRTTDDIMDPLQRYATKAMLKYLVQTKMWCDKCKSILDCERNVVQVEQSDETIHALCVYCYYIDKNFIDRIATEVIVAPKAPKYYPVPFYLMDIKPTIAPILTNRSESDDWFTDGRILLKTSEVKRQKKSLMNRCIKGKEPWFRTIPLRSVEDILTIPRGVKGEPLTLSHIERRETSDVFTLPYWDQVHAIYTSGHARFTMRLNAHLVRYILHTLGEDVTFTAIGPLDAVRIWMGEELVGLLMPIRPLG